MAPPDLLDRIANMEKRLRFLEAMGGATITQGMLAAYDRPVNTATVTVGGVSYVSVRVSWAVGPWLMRIGATVGMVGFTAGTPANAVIIYVTASELPPNILDPVTGHRHRGIEDDGPTL